MSERPPLRLTRKHVELCHRVVADAGPLPNAEPVSEDEFRSTAERLMAERGPGPVWLFAYGSLIWKPELPHSDAQRSTARGWHRAFSMQIRRFRGTVEQPGYMMCLDRGGECEGMALRLLDEDLNDQIDKLLRREVSRRAGLEAVRWIDIDIGGRPQKALAFYAAPNHLDNYVEGRPLQEVARGLARACGHWGSGAEYLYNTVSHLEDLGIHDEGLWQLQELVALEIEDLYP